MCERVVICREGAKNAVFRCRPPSFARQEAAVADTVPVPSGESAPITAASEALGALPAALLEVLVAAGAALGAVVVGGVPAVVVEVVGVEGG
jgi:hypothetical protein